MSEDTQEPTIEEILVGQRQAIAKAHTGWLYVLMDLVWHEIYNRECVEAQKRRAREVKPSVLIS